MSLLASFHQQLARLKLEPGAALVAVSGGADSVALLDLLVASRDVHRLDLIVAHADHGIHPESSTVARQVADLAAGYGLRTVTQLLNLGPDAGETAARTARWAWLEEQRIGERASWILTGHHADDQSETVLMRVLKGSGPAGLSAMLLRQGHIVRPLLPFRRDELVRYLRDRGLSWWEDPANADPAHLRSWLRTVILPSIRDRLPEVDRKLISTARQAALARAAWDDLLDHLPGLEWREEEPGSSVAASVLRGYASPLAISLLSAMARRNGGRVGPTRARRVLRALKEARSGATVEVGGGWRFELSFDRLHLLPPAARRDQPVSAALIGRAGELQWGEWRLTWSPETAPPQQSRDGMTAWFIPGSLEVRGWRAGDRVRPLRGLGSRPVVQCFQEAQVPRSRRDSWPMLDLGGSVVWIPGVCRSDECVPAGGAEATRVDVLRA